jgi:hypothetical protein
MMNRILIGLLCATGLACGSDVDTTVVPPTPTEAVFVPDGAPVAPGVSLRATQVDDNFVELEVVGHGLSNVYGSSFRIQTDAPLTMASFTSNYAIQKSAEPTPGLSFFVATRSGKAMGQPVDNEVIGSVRFNRTTAEGSPIRFVENRSDVVDADGTPIPALTWIGGELKIQ